MLRPAFDTVSRTGTGADAATLGRSASVVRTDPGTAGGNDGVGVAKWGGDGLTTVGTEGWEPSEPAQLARVVEVRPASATTKTVVAPRRNIVTT
ncbi:hypothetical protein OHA70_20760 [Kribbella sp. NBC_00382]|uniref:hypothetical protein n=1 Tax=Kribbella sp. NBC_00382 TaxID=2975967 RepID=UPI002E1A1558